MAGGLEGAATVAQLVGVDAVGLIASIKQAAVTAHQNKLECKHLAGRVQMIAELLPLVRDPEAMRPLAGLGAALREAHEFVMSCQGRGWTYRFFTASRQTERFWNVQSRIDSFLAVFPVISHIDITRRLYGTGSDSVLSRAHSSQPADSQVGKLKDTFGTELAILDPVSQEHIVRLLGSCAEQEERLLVYEHMDNGTLRNHLDVGSASWNWKTRVCVLLGAARAINRLHCRAVIHGNVTSSNILLDRSWTPRLSGFGASGSQAVDVIQKYGYADPEYCSTGRLKPATDLYSLGVVMLEVLTGNKPVVAVWKEKKNRSIDTTLVSWALPSIEARQLGDVLDRRHTSEPTPRQREALQLVASAAASCLRFHGDNRPAISDVVASLEKALQLLQ